MPCCITEKRGDGSRSKRAEEQELEEVMREIQQSFPPEGNKGNVNSITYLNLAIFFKFSFIIKRLYNLLPLVMFLKFLSSLPVFLLLFALHMLERRVTKGDYILFF